MNETDVNGAGVAGGCPAQAMPIGPQARRATRRVAIAWGARQVRVGGAGPVVVQSMTNTDTALLVEGALAAEAAVYAPVELRFAQERVAQAREALAAGDHKRAARLAAQAAADAELAMARARVAHLRAAADAQAAENAKLRAELLGDLP